MGIEIGPPVRLKPETMGKESSQPKTSSTSEDSFTLLEIKPEETPQAISELSGGALSTGILDGILAIIFDMWFPQYAGKPLFGFEPLPPIDDWLVGAAPLLTGIAATQLKSRDLMRVGVGGALYWGAMIIHQMILRAKAYGVGPRSSSASAGTAPTATLGKQPYGRLSNTFYNSDAASTGSTRGRYQVTS